MEYPFSYLWRFNGKIDRSRYALTGLLLFAVKHNLDRFLATVVFNRQWGIFNYWIPLDKVANINSLSKPETNFLFAMLLLSLPFIWMGVALTLRRLRDCGLPLFLVFLFFIPAINLIFFAVLSVLPTRTIGPLVSIPADTFQLAEVSIPTSSIGSAAVSIFVTLLCTLAAALFGTQYLKQYGWGLFVVVPFVAGMMSVLIDSARESKSWSRCMSVATASVCILGLALFAIAAEGIICLAMAFPLGLGIGLLGGFVGYVIQAHSRPRSGKSALIPILIFSSPLLMGFESVSAPVAPLFAVRTSINIKSSPETVWKHVVSFTELKPPTEIIFRAGIAYPIHAKIEGKGVGAVRRCVFSTGEFVEPIKVWDEPKLLRFSVESMPAPMQEWTPYREVHPAHLDGYLRSEQGQFLLTALPDGSTHLEGTTWYRDSIWPVIYWKPWSDFIIHRIHLRVLEHIKNLAEHEVVS